MFGLLSPGTYVSGLLGGRKIVTTSGTRVQITATSTPCQGVIVQSLRSNTGNISVGGSDVLGTLGSESGIEITPGQTITIFCKDLNMIWLDSDVNGEGAQYLIMQG